MVLPCAPATAMSDGFDDAFDRSSPSPSSATAAARRRFSTASNLSSVSSGTSPGRRAWKTFPDLESNREDWFDFWDDPSNGGFGTGQATQLGVIHALQNTYPEWDVKHLDAAVRELWSDYVADESGLVTAFDLLRPRSGLLDMVTMRVEWMSV